MTSRQSIAHARATHDTEQCIHCAHGWVYEVDQDTEEDQALPWWMCFEGKAMTRAGSR
jgi:hypothetical protein